MTSDLHRAVAELWLSSGLDGKFRQHWSDEVSNEFLTLHDEQAGPKQPWPYCVYSIQPSSLVTRMSGASSSSKFEHRTFACRFTIHAEQTASQSAKEMAAMMAEEVVRVFGGHPTTPPQEMPGVIQTTLSTDHGMRTESTNYSWILDYEILVESPLAYA
jgi:hypothetical protein